MSSPSDRAVSDENSENCGPYEPYGDGEYFTLNFREVGEAGEYHVRNQPGQQQRPTVSSFGGGSSTRPDFSVNCSARAVIHGTLDSESQTPATLLIYDFSFLAYRSSRIKDADISFEFQDKEGQGTPTIYKMAPYLKHTMIPSSEVHSRTLEAGISGAAGFGPVSLPSPNISVSSSREKTIEHQVEVVGDKPSDDYGRYYRAQWYLKENESQKKGIASFLRTCILLKRQHDGQFLMRPTVEAKANTATRILSLFATRTLDDPIDLDPSLSPYQNGVDTTAIDRWNLGAVDMDELWDWTFHNAFSRGIKTS